MPAVLILDDDLLLRDALTQTLQGKDFKVFCAATTEEAARHLENQHFDIVLLDYAMPERDGMWFMQNVKLPARTKVLLMTGHLNRTLINKMFSLGVCGYMIKPFDDETLIHNIHFHLGSPITAE
jgi:two-component system, response regulator YesN